MPVGASVTCAGCGGTYMRRDASDDKRHAKTQKHLAGEQRLVGERAFAEAERESRREDDLDDGWDDLDVGNLTPTPALAESKPAKTKREPKREPKPVAVAPAGSKECRVCHKTKPLAEFRVKASRPDGRDTLCAACAKDWLAAHRAKASK